MTQVTLSKKGIGPIEYNGYQYYVAPASERIIARWSGNSVDINGKAWDIPTREELNNVVYQNKEEIDEVDATVSVSTSPSLANIGTATARDGSNTRSTPWVWSSTEYSSYRAWAQRFSDGHIISFFKTSELWVVGIYKEPIT